MVACGAAASWGWIMPAPLARPAIRTGRPLISIVAWAVLGRVSVVMMAAATLAKWSVVPPTASRRAGKAARTFSTGSGTPMMPVEEGKTACGLQPKTLAAAAQHCSAAAMPVSPVAQLAFPELMSTVWTRPALAVRWRRSTMSGAAWILLVVYRAAAAAVSGAMMAERSTRPLALMPARTAPQRNPRGKEEVGSMKLLL